MRDAHDSDRRVRRTRKQVLDAFGDLVFTDRYERISVSDIADRANVGRSTFYENFENKEDVLRQALSAVFEPLADALTTRHDPGRLLRIVEHLADAPVRASGLLTGRPRATTTAHLSELIAERLDEHRRRRGLVPVLPVTLLAAQIAGMQIGLLEAWLHDVAATTAADVAAALVTASRALAEQAFRAP